MLWVLIRITAKTPLPPYLIYWCYIIIILFIFSIYCLEWPVLVIMQELGIFMLCIIFYALRFIRFKLRLDYLLCLVKDSLFQNVFMD